MHRLIPAALLAAAAVSAHAASLDCQRASAPRERAVCQSAELSRYDRQLAALYQTARRKLSVAALASVQADQNQWLRWVNQVCNPQAFADSKDYPHCLGEQYATRIEQLKGLQTLGGITFYPVARFVYAVQGKPAPNYNGYDANAYSGTFAWPQIDRPTPPQQAWNRQVQAQMLALHGGKNAGKLTLDQALQAAAADNLGTQADFSYAIYAANRRLIAAAFIESEYSGGPHGDGGQTHFLWRLDQGRLLTVHDVFRPDSDWQRKLGALGIKRLAATVDDNIDEQAAAAGIADINHWQSLDRTGLTVAFDFYEIAAYVDGAPTVHFGWPELRPYLNPTFNPATLPAPNPKAQ